MATNIKHLNSTKYQKALTLEDRNSLANIIATNRDNDGSLKLTLNSIANMLEKDPTTLSKEVKKRRITKDSFIPSYKFTKAYCKSCANYKNCTKRTSLTSSDLGICNNYKRFFCKYTTKFPYVCNGCYKRCFCNYPKFYYNPLEANDEYKYTLKDSREGSTFTLSEFKQIDEIVSNGLKNGQSVDHIINSNDLPICSKTAYNYLNKGYFTANKLNTHRMVRIKRLERKKTENSKILRQRKIGHLYEDYLAYQETHMDEILSQWDTVEGKKGGKLILSIKLVKLQIQFYFLLPNKTAKAVVDKIKKIGVSEVTLDEDADFTSDVYYTSGTFDITLLDNMETLPTYKKDVACYHSLDSKYKITRPRNERYWPYNDSREITLTSLVINPETLPDSLEDDAIDELFSEMINETSEMNQAISRSVELYSMIIDYGGAVRSLSGGLKNFESMDISPAIQEALSFGQQAYTSLQKQSEKLDKWIIETYPAVSEDELGNLQKTYRREVVFRRIDWD